MKFQQPFRVSIQWFFLPRSSLVYVLEHALWLRLCRAATPDMQDAEWVSGPAEKDYAEESESLVY